MKNCSKCKKNFTEIIRGFCRKCYYYLKYRGELSNIDKPKISRLTKIQKELLIGSLLGDAGLRRNKTSKYAYLKIERSVKDVKYLKYQFKILNNLCKSNVKTYIRNNDFKQYSYFISRSYKVLDDLFNKWYINGIKIVPKDLKLTPLIIAIWLCDDGNISTHHPKQGLLKTVFATNGFSFKEVEFLANSLTSRYKQNFLVAKTINKNQFIIVGCDKATRAMWKDIKKVFPISMKRKYNKPGFNLFK